MSLLYDIAERRRKRRGASDRRVVDPGRRGRRLLLQLRRVPPVRGLQAPPPAYHPRQTHPLHRLRPQDLPRQQHTRSQVDVIIRY